MAGHGETQILTASAADIAADMAYHRKAWGGFRKLMTVTAIGSAVILVFLFLIMY